MLFSFSYWIKCCFGYENVGKLAPLDEKEDLKKSLLDLTLLLLLLS